jgi:hypothetical protein
MRCVGYVRISLEEQRGNYCLAAQKHGIEPWVARQQEVFAGQLICVYEEECRSSGLRRLFVLTGSRRERPILGPEEFMFQVLLRGRVQTVDNYRKPYYIGVVPQSG